MKHKIEKSMMRTPYLAPVDAMPIAQKDLSILQQILEFVSVLSPPRRLIAFLVKRYG